jgi:DnaK suppressor protein
MNTNDLMCLKDMLLQLLDDISRNTDNGLEKLTESSDNLPDPLDRAYCDSERFLAVHKLNRDGVDRRKIIKSLQKIDEGIYGICEECEEEISIARLKARPLTSYCIHCKTELERQQGLV